MCFFCMFILLYKREWVSLHWFLPFSSFFLFHNPLPHWYLSQTVFQYSWLYLPCTTFCLISITLFSLTTLHLFYFSVHLFHSVFTHCLSLSLSTTTGEIILRVGSPTPCGFNPTAGIVNFDNLVMEVGINNLACATQNFQKGKERERGEEGLRPPLLGKVTVLYLMSLPLSYLSTINKGH